MLTGLTIGNFKAFGEPQHIPIRPLTLIFGANSSGKSSIIHSLLLANHADTTGQLDVFRPSLGGDAVELGGFRQYVHRGDTNTWPNLSLTAREATGRGPAGAFLAETGSNFRLDVQWGVVMPFASEEELNPVRSTPLVRTIEFFLDDKPLLSLYRRFADGLFSIKSVDTVRLDPIVGRILEWCTHRRELHSADLVTTAGVLCEAARFCTFDGRGWLPGAASLLRNGPGGSTVPEDLPAQFAQATHTGSQLSFWLFAPQLLTEVMSRLLRTFTTALQRLAYLGPLRCFPERHFLANPTRDTNWVAGGGGAWEMLKTHSSIRGQVNAWLSDPNRLSTPFTLTLRQLVATDDLLPILQDELETAEAGFDLPEKDENQAIFVDRVSSKSMDIPQELLDKLERGDITINGFMAACRRLVEQAREEESECRSQWHASMSRFDSAKASQMAIDRIHHELHTMSDLTLVDKRTNTPVSHRDVGVGISQVLPLLVHAYADERQIVAVEQPEIHLHPALQAELGDVFIESALGERKNTFLLETHSEHLILRILRRVRETTEGKLPAGGTPVRPEDVSVVYVQPGPKGAEVIELPVTPDGDFGRPWPNGFFAERFQELP